MFGQQYGIGTPFGQGSPFGNVQSNPVARVAEETVRNLKELEVRIEILKNELAQLCVSVGVPEAARLATTPIHALGITGNVGGHGTSGMQGGSPLGIGTPYSPPWSQGQTPWTGSPYGQAGSFSPYGYR